MTDALRSGVKKLEDVPENEKDWHPGSNNQVLDLVHPSMYCLVYGRTLVRGTVATPPLLAIPRDAWASFVSQKSAWLPSDFHVEDNGGVRLTSPYINNLHKSHEDLYTLIPNILERFIPMFERVLGAIDTKEQPFKGGRGIFGTSQSAVSPPFGRMKVNEGHIVPCVWDKYEDGFPPEDEEADANEYADYPGEGWRDRYRAWALTQGSILLPDALEEYQGSLENTYRVASLKGRTLQCIVKLANIHLTPENPEYTGGNWHVEGTRSYYRCLSSEDLTLDFRYDQREYRRHRHLCTCLVSFSRRTLALIQGMS